MTILINKFEDHPDHSAKLTVDETPHVFSEDRLYSEAYIRQVEKTLIEDIEFETGE
jgi:hypothetical protein